MFSFTNLWVVCVLQWSGVPGIIGAFGAVTYTRPRRGLTQVAFEEIPSDVTKVVLKNNDIAHMEAFPPFAQLSYLDVQSNHLSIFPNLPNISESLTDLRLAFNEIHTVPAERLDVLGSLKTLDIHMNRLTEIPDVAGPSQSLLTLAIENNPFPDVPALRTLGASLGLLSVDASLVKDSCLEKLSYPRAGSLYLFIVGNGQPLASVPNFSHWSAVSVYFMDAPLVCDCGVAWVKLITGAGGAVVTLTSQPCASPPHLVGRTWAQISADDLT